MKHRRSLILALPIVAISLIVTVGIAWIQSTPRHTSPAKDGMAVESIESVPLPLVVVPDRGEPRTERLAALEHIVAGMREDLSTTAEKLADAQLSKAEVLAELDRQAAAAATIAEVLKLVPDPLAWQHRDAKILEAALLKSESAFGEDRDLLRSALSSREQAVRLHGLGQYSEAVQAAVRSVASRRRLDSSDLSDLANLGDDLLLLGRLSLEHAETYLAAQEILHEARDVIAQTRGKSNPRYANALVALAGIADERGEFAAADAMYGEALTIHRQTRGEQSLPYAATLAKQGHMHLEWWKDYAWGKCFRALQIREQLLGPNHLECAGSLEDLALSAINLLDFERGEQLLKQAAAIRSSAQGQNHPELAEVTSLLALCYTERGDLAQALVNHRRAIRLCESARGMIHPHTAHYQLYLGQRCDADFDFARSYRMYDHCLTTLRSLGLTRHPLYAEALFYYADCVAWEAVFFEPSEKTELRDSERVLLKLVSIVESVPGGKALPCYPGALLKLAEGYYFENFQRVGFDKSWELFEQAVENVATHGGQDHPLYAELYRMRGRLLTSQGDYNAAQPAFEKAIEIDRKRFGTVNRVRNVKSLMHLIGMYLHQGTESKKALGLTREALELITSHFLKTAPGQSDISRLGLMFHWYYILGTELSAAAQEGSLEELYQSVVSARGVSTSLQMPDRLALDHPELDTLMQRVRESRVALKIHAYEPTNAANDSQWIQALTKSSDEKEDAENELALASRQFLKPEPMTTVSHLQSVLPKDGVFIDFLKYMHHGPPPGHRGPLFREFRIVAFIVRPNSPPKAVVLGRSLTIEQSINRLRVAIDRERDGLASNLPQAAAEVSQLVWQPLEKHLSGAGSILIAPDGPLCYLPFAVLPSRQPDRYLIEDYTIGYVTSARMACELLGKTSQKPNTGLLAVGGLDYQSGSDSLISELRGGAEPTSHGLLNSSLNWTPLPATEYEVKDVLSKYEKTENHQERSQLLTGSIDPPAFTKALEAKWRYVHFAGHGFFAEEKLPDMIGSILSGRHLRERGDQEYVMQRNQSLLSGLVLVGESQSPSASILTAEEVAGLDLRGTELVVMSACDTGLGRTAGGEGVIGLKRAFLAAGSRSVVTSLWKVNDAATSLLMQQFYANLLENRLPKWEALRQAQLFVLHHPEQIEQQSQLLASRGLRPGQTRPIPVGNGDIPSPKVPPIKPPLNSASHSDGRVSPAAWGAFVLYGDGR